MESHICACTRKCQRVCIYIHNKEHRHLTQQRWITWICSPAKATWGFDQLKPMVSREDSIELSSITLKKPVGLPGCGVEAQRFPRFSWGILFLTLLWLDVKISMTGQGPQGWISRGFPASKRALPLNPHVRRYRLWGQDSMTPSWFFTSHFWRNLNVEAANH